MARIFVPFCHRLPEVANLPTNTTPAFSTPSARMTPRVALPAVTCTTPLDFHHTQGLVLPQPTATADRVVYGKFVSTRSVRRKAGEGV